MVDAGTKGTEPPKDDFVPGEREIVVAGGLIRYLKAQQPAGV